MSTHLIDLIRMTPDGEPTLPEAVKARLRQLLERQPGANAFSVYEEEGVLVLVPVRESEEPAYIPTLEEIAEVVAHFRARTRVREMAPPSLHDEFTGGLTYKEYFALSEEEEKAVWDEVFADEAMEIEDFTEVEVAPDARVPSR
jgi:hypothetical protein